MVGVYRTCCAWPRLSAFDLDSDSKRSCRNVSDSLFSSGLRSVDWNMSNSVSQNLLQQSLLRPIGLEHQSKRNSSSIPANTLFQSVATKTANTRKSQLSSKFLGKSLSLRSPNHTMGSGRGGADITRAVLTTDPASQVKFLLSNMCAMVSFIFILDYNDIFLYRAK